MNEELFPAVHAAATLQAAQATASYLQQHGDHDACGFAWVNVYNVRSNSKLGKALVAAGFSKSYTGGLQLWNPSGHNTQSISAKEQGAQAYVQALRAAGITEVYAGSRMD